MKKILCALLGLILTLPGFAACPTGQVEQTYTSATGTVTQNGTPTPTNPIEPVFYQQGDMILRKVGDIADSYDATTGKITRRVGVKVLDGTEIIDYYDAQTRPGIFNVEVQNKLHDVAGLPISSHFNKVNRTGITNIPVGSIGASVTQGNNVVWINVSNLIPNGTDGFNTWIADQYNAGTPVTVYYPLATETTEDWNETTYCAPNIKIATTAYNSARFSPVVTELNDTIATIRSVVTNTINQTKAIADLQATKQTRPDENCPAGKKCLLVEDNDGQPHWYEIIESASRLPDGFTELQYIESTGTQYIDTGIVLKSKATVTTVGQFLSVSSGTPISIWGFMDSSSTYPRWGWSIYTNTWLSALNATITSGQADTNKHTFINTCYYNNNNVLGYDSLLDGNKISHNVVDKTETYTSNILSAYLFARNNANTAGNFSSSRIFSFNIVQDDVEVINLIPAKRNSDNVVGMYDTVSGRFFTNAGSGTFVAGPEVQ
ncbi:MAG: hypothetical protein IKM94_00220 [Alphaproteobacteria bacterium]|nr:hypothetical protein [Alphaproteobacteria bacterium]